MSGHLTPEQITEYLEVSQDQFLELLRLDPAKRNSPEEPKG
jgi:hypothetical protein